MSKKAKNHEFPILAFKGHIMASSTAKEAGAGLVWVDFSFVMSQETPISWALNSGAAQAYHTHPSEQAKKSTEGLFELIGALWGFLGGWVGLFGTRQWGPPPPSPPVFMYELGCIDSLLLYDKHKGLERDFFEHNLFLVKRHFGVMFLF